MVILFVNITNDEGNELSYSDEWKLTSSIITYEHQLISDHGPISEYPYCQINK